MWDVKSVVIASVSMFSIIRLPDGFVCLSFSLMPHFKYLEYALCSQHGCAGLSESWAEIYKHGLPMVEPFK
jgi:hypothetical protein